MKKLFILLAAFAACSGAFANDTIRFTWEAGTTEKFIGLGGYGGDFTIDWGDGTAIETKTVGYGSGYRIIYEDTLLDDTTYSHTYVQEGTYTVTVAGITADCKFTCAVLSHSTVYDNLVTGLDVSGVSELIVLDCNDNKLTSLDISNNTALKVLSCEQNKLTSLDVSNNTALIGLYCRDNLLENLNVENNILLYAMMCDGNQLTSLDLSNNTLLRGLFCEYNQLTNLDFGNIDTLIYCLIGSNRLPLSILYTASEIVTEGDKKHLGPQNLLPVNIAEGVAYGEGQNEFGGIYTEYTVLKSDSTTPASLDFDYSVANGMITFHNQDTFYMTMTNDAIVSHEEYPAEVNVKIIVGEAAGTEQPAECREIRVYPNPTSGVVNIDGVNGEEISVYTSMGILVERAYGSSIDLSKQPAGVYMLKVGNKISRVVKN